MEFPRGTREGDPLCDMKGGEMRAWDEILVSAGSTDDKSCAGINLEKCASQTLRSGLGNRQRAPYDA